ncbi:hypothetical protein GCM10010210_02360 [Pseudonocardia hydrocarbonoxydans]
MHVAAPLCWLRGIGMISITIAPTVSRSTGRALPEDEQHPPSVTDSPSQTESVHTVGDGGWVG